MHDVQGVGQGFAPAEVSARVSDRVRAASLAVDVLIVGSVALVLGLIQLGTPSLWVDEALTAYEIRWPYSRSLEGYYWLYYSIEKPWAAIAGYSEWALRFPSVVAAMLAGALMIVLARRLFDRRIALLSGLFLVTNPFVVKWSQQARGYTMLLAVSLLATIFLLRALERGSRSAFALYGLAFAAVIVWHPVGGLVLGLPHLVPHPPEPRALLPARPARSRPWSSGWGCFRFAVDLDAIRGVGHRHRVDPVPYVATVANAVSGHLRRRLVGTSSQPRVCGYSSRQGSGASRRGSSCGPSRRSSSPSSSRSSSTYSSTVYLIDSAPAFALLAAVAVTGSSTTPRCDARRDCRCGDGRCARPVVLVRGQHELARGGLASRPRAFVTGRAAGGGTSSSSPLAGSRCGGVLRFERRVGVHS